MQTEVQTKSALSLALRCSSLGSAGEWLSQLAAVSLCCRVAPRCRQAAQPGPRAAGRRPHPPSSRMGQLDPRQVGTSGTQVFVYFCERFLTATTRHDNRLTVLVGAVGERVMILWIPLLEPWL